MDPGSHYHETLKKALVTDDQAEPIAIEPWDTPTLDFEGTATSESLLTTFAAQPTPVPWWKRWWRKVIRRG